MDKGDGALLLGFFGLGMDNGVWRCSWDEEKPRLGSLMALTRCGHASFTAGADLSLSVSAVSGRLEEMDMVWSKPKRLPCGPRAKGTRLE